MTSTASHTADTVDQLQRKLVAAEAENDRLLALMAKKEAQWEAAKAALFEQFRLAIERQFGPSTEKYRVEQGDLLINEAEAAVDEEESATADESTADASAIESHQPAKPRSRGGRVAQGKRMKNRSTTGFVALYQ